MLLLKVGTKVIIRSDLKHCKSPLGINKEMLKYQGLVTKITGVRQTIATKRSYYNLEFDHGVWLWDDSMVTSYKKEPFVNLKLWL